MAATIGVVKIRGAGDEITGRDRRRRDDDGMRPVIPAALDDNTNYYSYSSLFGLVLASREPTTPMKNIIGAKGQNRITVHQYLLDDDDDDDDDGRLGPFSPSSTGWLLPLAIDG
jgi:hypothetical protein